MKLLQLVLLFTFLVVHSSVAAQGEQTLYVWANNSLNMRSSPDAKADVLRKIEYGAAVEVLETTDVPITLSLENSPDINSEYKHFTFTENWVKVLTEEGNSGYVAPHFLSRIRPELKMKKYEWENRLLNISPVFSDTVVSMRGPIIQEPIVYKVFNYYGAGVQSVLFQNNEGGGISYAFHDYSLREVLLIFGSSNSDYQDYKLANEERGWFSIGFDLCGWHFHVGNDQTIKISGGCNC